MKKYVPPFLTGVSVIVISILTSAAFYARFPHFDKIYHVSGGFIVAWFFAMYWRGRLAELKPFDKFVIFTASAALIGLIWELTEFSTGVPPLSHYPIIHHYMYIGDLVDTLGDLVADVLGGALFGLVSFLL